MTTVALGTRKAGWLSYLKTAFASGVLAVAGAAAPTLAADELPAFRQVADIDVTTSLRKVRRVRFVVDTNFPPFAFRDNACSFY